MMGVRGEGSTQASGCWRVVKDRPGRVATIWHCIRVVAGTVATATLRAPMTALALARRVLIQR